MDVAYLSKLLTPGWGRPGARREGPRGLVIHWTADLRTGANARAVRDWYERNRAYKVSAHYVVDDRSIVQCVPESEVAYHTGKAVRQPGLSFLGRYPNNSALAVEWCVNSDGDGAETYRNVVGLCGAICSSYGWGAEKLFRHYDITGKLCPAFFVDDDWARRLGYETGADGAWQRFRRDVTIATRAVLVGRVVPEAR
jgi:N-acetylmuramoyl-L-alanine amidase CwlA